MFFLCVGTFRSKIGRAVPLNTSYLFFLDPFGHPLSLVDMDSRLKTDRSKFGYNAGCQMEIKNEKLLLRPWKLEDLDSLVKYANNRNVSINLRDSFPYPYTEKDGKKWIEAAALVSPPEQFAMVKDAHAVGGIGLILGTDIFRRSAEIGFWLGEAYWGRGLAVEAVKMVTAYAFETFDLTRIFAGVFARNRASARALEKAGFMLEGRLRRAVIKEGEVFDELMYSLVQ